MTFLNVFRTFFGSAAGKDDQKRQAYANKATVSCGLGASGLWRYHAAARRREYY